MTMSSIKQVHYNIDKITECDANFNIIYGEKSNGKSYQVKHKKAIEHYLETGKRFILMRRWQADLTTLWIEQYFQDVDVEKLTDGKYNCISVWRKVIYLSTYNVETGKVVRGEKIGYTMALSTEQHYSGGSFLDVDTIIFEEFMERRKLCRRKKRTRQIHDFIFNNRQKKRFNKGLDGWKYYFPCVSVFFSVGN